jgi:hypothetical protein
VLVVSAHDCVASPPNRTPTHESQTSCTCVQPTTRPSQAYLETCCTQKPKPKTPTGKRFTRWRHSCCATHTAHREKPGPLQVVLTQHALSCSTPTACVRAHQPAHSKAEACAHLAPTAQLRPSTKAARGCVQLWDLPHGHTTLLPTTTNCCPPGELYLLCDNPQRPCCNNILTTHALNKHTATLLCPAACRLLLACCLPQDSDSHSERLAAPAAVCSVGVVELESATNQGVTAAAATSRQ